MLRQHRVLSGTSAEWSARNPILGDGVPGFESNTGRYKIGDGQSRWSDLPFLDVDGEEASLPNWIVSDNSLNRTLLADAVGGGVGLSDTAAVPDGSFNGLFWLPGDGDGGNDQGVVAFTGPNSEHRLEFKGDGVLRIDGQPVVPESVVTSAVFEMSVTAEGGVSFPAPLTDPGGLPSDWSIVDGTLYVPNGQYIANWSVGTFNDDDADGTSFYVARMNVDSITKWGVPVGQTLPFGYPSVATFAGFVISQIQVDIRSQSLIVSNDFDCRLEVLRVA